MSQDDTALVTDKVNYKDPKSRVSSRAILCLPSYSSPLDKLTIIDVTDDYVSSQFINK